MVSTNLEQQQLTTYQGISQAAVLAAVLACASPLVLASPVLAVVPMVTMVVGVVAWRKIAKSQGALTGSSLAAGAVVIGALFLGWGLSWQVMRQASVSANAEALAARWIALAQEGQVREAHQLTLETSERAGTQVGMNKVYDADGEPAEALQSFFASPPLKTILAEGKNCQVELVAVARQNRVGHQDNIVLEFEVTSQKGEVQGLWLVAERRYDPGANVVHWRISGASDRLPAGF